MRILIVGSGGREHAMAWAAARSKRDPEIFIAPGNAGTGDVGKNVPIPADDIEGLLAFATEMQIDLTIVGPEVPLVLGMVDRFEEAKLPIVGPTAAAARLEGSKAFAKQFMEQWGIPTASYRSFSGEEFAAAVAYVQQHPVPLVLKADGLAAGKGVLICESHEEAIEGLHTILRDGAFGAAGASVVIEEFMEGEEASVFAVTDGADYVVLSAAQDHKRVGEGDTGLNTGGMGAYAPAPMVDEKILERVCNEVIEPTIAGMQAQGTPYKGILFCGLMLTSNGPKVVEFNCRFGDPETQVVLPLLTSDFVELMERVAFFRVGGYNPSFRKGFAATVVMASGGYPGPVKKGRTITGIGESTEDCIVFHAGSVRNDQGDLVTSGGRVLAVTGMGKDLPSALIEAYDGVGSIRFEGAFCRRDIGWRGLKHLE